MNKTFFIADTHFGHANIIKYSNRPFADVQEHDAALIKNWNKIVKGDARVFVLGDFALTGKSRIVEIGQQLNGRKTLICGNHDGGSLNTYYAAGFEMISKHPLVFGNLLLSHIPQEQANPFVNVHGHVHDKQGELEFSPHHFCVSIENINYAPIELKQLLLEIQKKRDNINEHILS